MPDRLTTLERILCLKQVHLFSRLSARDLQLLARETHEIDHPRGSFVFEEGDEGDALYIIVEGNAGVLVGADRGVVAILGPQDCFGELAVLTQEPRSATVEALKPLRTLRIRRQDFRTVLMAHPHMAFSIFEFLAARLKRTTRLLHELPLHEINRDAD